MNIAEMFGIDEHDAEMLDRWHEQQVFPHDFFRLNHNLLRTNGDTLVQRITALAVEGLLDRLEVEGDLEPSAFGGFNVDRYLIRWSGARLLVSDDRPGSPAERSSAVIRRYLRADRPDWLAFVRDVNQTYGSRRPVRITRVRSAA
jgi:hypothetical protein